MVTRTSPWDAAAVLTTPEEMASYLDAAFEDGDPLLILHALDVVARARGMTDVADVTAGDDPSGDGSARADGRPGLAEVLDRVRALGLKVTVGVA